MRSYRLLSGDEVEVAISAEALTQSALLSHLVADLDDPTQAIPVCNLRGVVVHRVVEFCVHLHEAASKPDTSDWMQQRLAALSNTELFELIIAANYLDVAPLLDAACAQVAATIKDKTPAEIRALYGITNDFTPDEEEAIRKENAWCQVRDS